MRACLLLCAALALVASRPRAAAHEPAPALEPARLHHIKTQILAKLGLTSRPTPLGAPPRDVVRQILARAADPQPERRPEPEHSMREIIAIAHRGDSSTLHSFLRKCNVTSWAVRWISQVMDSCTSSLRKVVSQKRSRKLMPLRGDQSG